MADKSALGDGFLAYSESQEWRNRYVRALEAHVDLLKQDKRDLMLLVAAIVNEAGGQIEVPDKAIVNAKGIVKVYNQADKSHVLVETE